MIFFSLSSFSQARELSDSVRETQRLLLQYHDAQLNTIYKRIQKRFARDTYALRLLNEAERSWIRYRDTECAFQGVSGGGGDGTFSADLLCLDNLTRQRIKDLKIYLTCEKNELNCPVPVFSETP